MESYLSKTMDIKRNTLLNSKSNLGKLFYLISDNSYNQFVEILDNSNEAIIDEKDENGNTMLNYACIIGNYHIVKYLIEKMANINTQNNIMNTPLHYALLNKNYAIIDLLISNKANQNLVNLEGLNAWQNSKLILEYHKDNYFDIYS